MRIGYFADGSWAHKSFEKLSENINSQIFMDTVKKYQADLFVSMSFNQIFRDKIRNLPEYKTINCHAGKVRIGDRMKDHE